MYVLTKIKRPVTELFSVQSPLSGGRLDQLPIPSHGGEMHYRADCSPAPDAAPQGPACHTVHPHTEMASSDAVAPGREGECLEVKLWLQHVSANRRQVVDCWVIMTSEYDLKS
ncbi:hypothetical protein NQZ68_030870 [Dissostichus eleginoides]|nr:hypothetical protein NQZ68_030870 [Dissostichus eleginoides]